MKTETTAAAPTVGQKHLVLRSELRPMKDAPRDGTEILAFHKDGQCFHPIFWKDWRWKKDNHPAWGMRWDTGYFTQDGFYDGWIPYPILSQNAKATNEVGCNPTELSEPTCSDPLTETQKAFLNSEPQAGDTLPFGVSLDHQKDTQIPTMTIMILDPSLVGQQWHKAPLKDLQSRIQNLLSSSIREGLL